MTVGFGGTQYLGFVVMLVLLLVVMIGAYWPVLIKPRDSEETNALEGTGNVARSLQRARRSTPPGSLERA